MNESSHGGEGARRRVQALRAAYLGGRLVVSADCATLARARLVNGHTIDARDVAEAILRRMSRDPARPPDGGSGGA